MSLHESTLTTEELSHLPELEPGRRPPADTYIGYVVPGDGPADAKRNAVYDQECLALVYDPEETFLYGLLPAMSEYRGKCCLYCGKALPFPTHEFVVHRFHTGKYEATYRVFARNQEEADAYVEEHRLELDPEEVFPLCDDYQCYL